MGKRARKPLRQHADAGASFAVGRGPATPMRTVAGAARSEAALELIEAFSKHITTGIPFVIAKFAISLDGKIATRSGDSKWISSPASRRSRASPPS